MMTTATPTETPAQQYARLVTEQSAALTAARADRTEANVQRLRAAQRQLRELLATPPDGYSLPKAALDLVADAKAHGWLTLVQWTSPDYPGEPFVTIQVGRKLVGEELVEARGDCWKFQVGWHSRGCAAGKVRRFGSGLANTPDSPAAHDAPSVKAIRAVIAAHPAVTA